VIREESSERQHVALPEAVAAVIYKLSGEQVGGTRTAEGMRLFNDVAHGMAHIIPIHATQQNGMPKALGHLEVVQGRFEHGALFFRAVDGTEYHHLTVQRRDITTAVASLKAASLRIK
jgi:hypothetical protein